MSDNQTHTHNTDIGGIGLVTVLLALIFLFVWPGPLRQEYHLSKDLGIIRIDRINGRVTTLRNGHYARVPNIGPNGAVWVDEPAKK
jgi:hypothetical protein